MSESSGSSPDQERPRTGLVKQDSVDVASQLSSHSAFTEDSLDLESVRQKSETSQEDTETDQAAVTIRLQSSQLTSPSSNTSSLERERQEDLEVFGLHADMFSYENGQQDEEFFFDSDLNLEGGVEDNIVAAELLRPERLDTVEEVSEPASGISSQLTSLTYSQDMDHASMPAQDVVPASLQSSFSSKEEMFSTTELEFRNSFRSQRSYDSSLTYVRNPFEIFGKTEG